MAANAMHKNRKIINNSSVRYFFTAFGPFLSLFKILVLLRAQKNKKYLAFDRALLFIIRAFTDGSSGKFLLFSVV